jgi:hypothetical protein
VENFSPLLVSRAAYRPQPRMRQKLASLVSCGDQDLLNTKNKNTNRSSCKF